MVARTCDERTTFEIVQAGLIGSAISPADHIREPTFSTLNTRYPNGGKIQPLGSRPTWGRASEVGSSNAMATTASSSSLSLHLGNVWRLLALRCDIEDVIKELLGHFSLEKIYAEGDKKAYQNLVTTLISQLNVIFAFQRLSLPAEKVHTGPYLGFLASWETSLRCVEFVLQVIEEGRDSLWEARQLRDGYLAEFLLSSLRFLTLHPKGPAGQRARERRDRFSRIHRSLERVYDSYPGPKSFLLQTSIEITGALRNDPDSLSLPSTLRYDLPNLGTELYPLAPCLLSDSVSIIVPHNGSSDDWLRQFLALRDVTLFVVGANIQYTVNRELRNTQLQATTAETRNAIFTALDNIKLPHHLSKTDLISSFTDTFRIVLPDTHNVASKEPSESDDDNIGDALDSLCAKLENRMVVNRVSDRELLHGITEITRNIALFDDPSGQFRTARPRLYVLNCRKCHLAGYSQLRYFKNIHLPLDPGEGTEIILPPGSKCRHCGDVVTMAREIQLARRTWDLLSPLESNADTINVERHLPTQFQLGAPKAEAGNSFHPSDNSMISPTSPRNHGAESQFARPVFPFPSMSDRSNSATPTPSSPYPPSIHPKFDQSRSDFSPLESRASLVPPETPRTVSSSTESRRFSQDYVNQMPRTGKMASTPTFDSITRSTTTTTSRPSDKGKLGWLTGRRRESVGGSGAGDTSSISSSAIESQRIDEISLKTMVNSVKSSKVKGPRTINVYLSQNSTYALFWTQTTILLSDVGTSPPSAIRGFSTESTCLLAAVSRMYLAYVIGTRDNKLTFEQLRIVNLIQPSTPAVEYRMSSKLWCKCITICPMENYVVVGFENSIVRFFKTTNTEAPREDRLHSVSHRECKNCTLDTLSFSRDGLVLLASTRNPQGTIQIFQWKFPFLKFTELQACRYYVPLHESEDNGVSAAIYRSSRRGDDLICISTWTQSGVPVLVHPLEGNKTEIKSDASRHSRVGNRIQCASFSPSGSELALVNDKGYLYQVSNLNSSPMDFKKLATSKELTSKSDSFALSYMSIMEEDVIVLAWVDPVKGAGMIKKIPVICQGDSNPTIMPPIPPEPPSPRFELPGDITEIPQKHEADALPLKKKEKPAVELPAEEAGFFRRLRLSK
ncbi:hypothetical protein FQN53_001727 [Emmonsiellopsis sp. PD_33]|nr:hypothetical protein FQN53_001727 [Emmonsiellopsis sp. PD_33]